MYEKYYAHQLYKHGYLRINDKKNKDKITKIIKMANELRSKKGYPNDLMAVNVGLRPDHRMSIPELEQSFENCIKTQGLFGGKKCRRAHGKYIKSKTCAPHFRPAGAYGRKDSKLLSSAYSIIFLAYLTSLDIIRIYRNQKWAKIALWILHFKLRQAPIDL